MHEFDARNNPWVGHVSYAASKDGIALMMRILAQEAAHRQIRINAIASGAIRRAINKTKTEGKAVERFTTLILHNQIDMRKVTGYICFMIRSFRHRGLKRLYERGDRSQIGADMIDKVENILAILDRANGPDALNLPSFRLHPLRGDLKGFWAITLRANWRIIWRFDGEDAVDVELIDYH